MKAKTKTVTVTEKQNAEYAIGFSREVLANLKDCNNVLTTSKKTRAVFHTHFANMESGEFGIADLISKILREHEASFPACIGDTELRQIAIAGSMFTSEILAEVENTFTAGSIRYPLQTVKNYLSTYMLKQNKVGKIQLTGKEDADRPAGTCRPRCKWFAIA